MTDFTLDSESGRLVAACRDDLAQQAFAMLRRVAALKDPAAQDGVIVEFGWAPLKLKAEGSELRVCEPDFKGNAFCDYIPSVDKTLRVLAMQASLLNTLGLKGIAPRFSEKVVISDGCLSCDWLIMIRQEPDRLDDSGWTIEESNGKPRDWRAVFVHKIAVVRQCLMAPLALPYGYRCHMNGCSIEAVFDETDRWVWGDAHYQ